jgi:hypothetical protein
MATYKNTNGDWYITVDSGVGTIYVDGNLDVTGNITYVSEIAVNDAFIAVAANNNGTVTSMGLLATKTANTTWAGLRFNTITSQWEISPSVYGNGAPISAYEALATGNATVGGNPGAIQFNDGGSFGGSDNLLFDNANSYVYANVTQYIGYQTTPPNEANAVAVYSNVVGAGGTGLYFTSSAANDELVSKSKAIVFSIIF